MLPPSSGSALTGCRAAARPPRAGGDSCRRANTHPPEPNLASESHTARQGGRRLTAVVPFSTVRAARMPADRLADFGLLEYRGGLHRVATDQTGAVSVRRRTDDRVSTDGQCLVSPERSSSRMGWLTEAGPDASPSLRLRVAASGEPRLQTRHPETRGARRSALLLSASEAPASSADAGASVLLQSAHRARMDHRCRDPGTRAAAPNSPRGA